MNGHLVSKHIKKILVHILEFEDKRMAQYKLAEKNINSVFTLATIDKLAFNLHVKLLLQKVFMNIERQIESQISFDVQLSGSTLSLAIVGPTFVVSANCGDSRSALIRQDGSVAMESADHKPNRADEKQRIEVQYKGRVKRQIDIMAKNGN